MQLVFQNADNVPEGNYGATLQAIEPISNEHGPGLRWSFAITKGEHSGRQVSRFTGDKPTANNSCGRMLVAILGRSPQSGEAIDITTQIGKPFMVQVKKTPSGSVRVESAMAFPV